MDELAKTPAGQLRQIRVNQVWESYKETVKEALHSDHGRSIYAQRKIEVEPIFSQMKRNFGMHRTHVRGKIAVHNDLGLLFLEMNLQRLMKYILNNMKQRWFILLDFTDLTKEYHLNSIFLQILIEKHILIFIKSERAFFCF